MAIGDMGRELIRRATVALQHAAEARTVEFQARHADEARSAFEHAVRSVRQRFERAEQKPSEAARVIARHSVAFEMEELQHLEARLTDLEARIAAAIVAKTDPRDHRRFRLAE
jgi:hypothetical protein